MSFRAYLKDIESPRTWVVSLPFLPPLKGEIKMTDPKGVAYVQRVDLEADAVQLEAGQSEPPTPETAKVVIEVVFVPDDQQSQGIRRGTYSRG